ncbi:hypothetical protein, partial [Thioalkalivibrio sp. ALE16]|uniref:hypothetical protein n=1 Tax=Thioalkalivibrio sp. ALE16 TaxID=1158172 RepID=UPI001E2E10F9
SRSIAWCFCIVSSMEKPWRSSPTAVPIKAIETASVAAPVDQRVEFIMAVLSLKTVRPITLETGYGKKQPNQKPFMAQK